MVQGPISRSCLLLAFCFPVVTWSLDLEVPGQVDQQDWDAGWGSGWSPPHLPPADSPQVAPPPHCTHHFLLPSSSHSCRDNMAGPQDLAKSRQLVLQNMVALQTLVSSSDLDQGQQAREEVRAIVTEHQTALEAMGKMDQVFVSLGDQRRDSTEPGVLTSMKDKMADTRTAGHARQITAAILEKNLSRLEETLLAMQRRIHSLLLNDITGSTTSS
ncbi:uncharacterized protein LOC133550725 [Nerophis ophidion]|uniref:uncharacterized protein LOC133550725 n=1 Tax=Nerophis ophidion TaxID=159077 RepID=UPI002ADF341C|nr:uncharacterized protein LOC133550725 [Nerophis ophidion]